MHQQQFFYPSECIHNYSYNFDYTDNSPSLNLDPAYHSQDMERDDWGILNTQYDHGYELNSESQDNILTLNNDNFEYCSYSYNENQNANHQDTQQQNLENYHHFLHP